MGKPEPRATRGGGRGPGCCSRPPPGAANEPGGLHDTAAGEGGRPTRGPPAQCPPPWGTPLLSAPHPGTPLLSAPHSRQSRWGTFCRRWGGSLGSGGPSSAGFSLGERETPRTAHTKCGRDVYGKEGTVLRKIKKKPRLNRALDQVNGQKDPMLQRCQLPPISICKFSVFATNTPTATFHGRRSSRRS